MKQGWLLLGIGMLASHSLGCESKAGSEGTPGGAERSAKDETNAKDNDSEAAPASAGSTGDARSKTDQGKVDITGSYTLSGQDSLGKPITGTVEIRPNKNRENSYLISRVENGKKLKGVMYRDGEHVFSAWSKKGAGLRTFKPNGDSTLEGTYFGNTEPRLAKETLRGGSSELTGRYTIKDSTFASGNRYSGTVSISVNNDIYKLKYKLAYSGRRENFTAYGLRADDLLGVATHAGGPFGFAHYSISDEGVLQGEIGRSNDSAEGPGKETLKRK